MSLLKEFSYSDIFQRRLIYYNLSATIFLVTFIFSDISLAFNHYAPYESTFRIVFLAVLAGLTLGNLAGRSLFSKSGRYRLIYMLSDLAFTVGCALFLARKHLASGVGEPLLDLFFSHRFALYTAVLLISFFTGMKGVYFLKIACGDFIDDHRSLLGFFMIILAAVAAGMAHAFLSFHVPRAYYAAFVPVMLILPTLFLIRLPYFPQTMYAQEYKEHHHETGNAARKREDLAFAYLGFSYILLYLFFGYQTITRVLGDFIHVQLLYIFACAAALMAGFALARLLKKPYLPLYTEVLYPPAFVLFFVAVYATGGGLGTMATVSLFIPVAGVFGFSMYHMLREIIETYDHAKRFAIIDFSLLILPAPILAALNLFDFTNLWFFILLYAVFLMNTALPVINLAQSERRPLVKTLYLAGAVALIPIMLFVHINFDIALNGRLYVSHISGYADIASADAPSRPGAGEESVRFNGRDIFSSRDDTVKNLWRALVPLALFAKTPEDGGSRILFIDGNQRFYRNPAIAYFPGAVCLDYIPPRAVDFREPPFTGRDFYFVEHGEILRYLKSMESPANMIVDIPNLYDLACNRFRFTEEYYAIAGRSISRDGLFVQVLNLSRVDSHTLSSALSGLKGQFGHFAGFLFSDHLVLLCARTASALELTREGFERMSALFGSRPDLAGLFINEYQPLAHLLFTDIDDMLASLKDSGTNPWPCPEKGSGFSLDANLENVYLSDNLRIGTLIPDGLQSTYFRAGILAGLRARGQAFSMMKKASLMEVRGEFDGETAILAQLGRMGDYQPDLRAYITSLLAFKERHYFAEAVRLEKGRGWNDAGTLYRAIININPDNFEANYRLGMLSITVQNLDDAFVYLQKAMSLKRDDTKVLYQMGVLLFAMGRPREALEYFTRAMELRESTAGIFHYTGLCYEKLGRTQEAKTYYEKALLADPNDCAIQSSLKRIETAIEEEKSRWKTPDPRNQFEVEQGESIPLPINQSARDVRLDDKEAESAEERP
ncbi:MAG: tetratricopeptide repeat protein [Spirochaetota bacterium]|nr:tetratricopeptide repeat protein [Spirochaetota bacterium]